MQTWLIPITLLAWTSLVAGCAANKEAVLPTEGPDIQAIYARHLHESGHNELQAVHKSLQENPARKAASRKAASPAHDAIEVRFARLPNPDLRMYVFPHLAGPQQVPVPGYVTAFPMYERVEYARPGEGVAPPHLP